MIKNVKKISLVDFPEEEKKEAGIGMKFYCETSYENQMAVLSHWLHNHGKNVTKEEQAEIIESIKDFLERKEFCQGFSYYDMTDNELLKVAEDSAQYGLFSDFFDIPFPTPQNPKFTFIDLFAGVGGIRLGMQEAGGKCIYSSEWNSQAQKTYYLLTTANMDAADLESIEREITRISQIHGCQVIVNGVYTTLKYYLRLMNDPAEFIDKYVELLKQDETVKFQHKTAWNDIISGGIA